MVNLNAFLSLINKGYFESYLSLKDLISYAKVDKNEMLTGINLQPLLHHQHKNATLGLYSPFLLLSLTPNPSLTPPSPLPIV